MEFIIRYEIQKYKDGKSYIIYKIEPARNHQIVSPSTGRGEGAKSTIPHNYGFLFSMAPIISSCFGNRPACNFEKIFSPSMKISKAPPSDAINSDFIPNFLSIASARLTASGSYFQTAQYSIAIFISILPAFNIVSGI